MTLVDVGDALAHATLREHGGVSAAEQRGGQSDRAERQERGAARARSASWSCEGAERWRRKVAERQGGAERQERGAPAGVAREKRRTEPPAAGGGSMDRSMSALLAMRECFAELMSLSCVCWCMFCAGQ